MTAVLLSVTAVIAYFFGSMSTPILSSHIYFHENLLNYSRDNVGITRFLKRHGGKGVAVLLGTELVKLIVPLLIGGLLMLIVDNGAVGRAFALFCVMMGTVFPIMYRFHGEPSIIVISIGSFFVSGEIALAGIIALIAVYLLTHYVSLAAIIEAVIMILVAVMSLDDNLVRNVYLLSCLLVIVEYRKNIVALLRGREKKFRYREDVSFMFDDDYGDGEK